MKVRSSRYRHGHSSQAEASPMPIRPFLQTRGTWPLSTTRSATNLWEFKGSRPPEIEGNVVHQKGNPRAECDDCEKQLSVCQWLIEYECWWLLGDEDWLRTNILMIHVSTVCSDSGSNEKRPIVPVGSARCRWWEQKV